MNLHLEEPKNRSVLCEVQKARFETEVVGFITCVFRRLWVEIAGRQTLFSYNEKISNCQDYLTWKYLAFEGD